MNGVHDLGGMHGFGPVEREENEPPFHAPWERSVWAIMRTALREQIFNIDEMRHAIERMEPAHYLSSSYYEHWLAALETLLAEKGVLSAAELDRRTELLRSQPTPVPAGRAASLPAERPPAGGQVGAPVHEPGAPAGFAMREATAPPRFAPGDAILTRNLHPTGHTRLPRYARGKRGVIGRVHGVFVFPDSNAHGLGEQPQYVYSVRFDGSELWGEAGSRPGEVVHLDLWESYLQAATDGRTL